jgi:capsule polysaccharide modification protein KpsS
VLLEQFAGKRVLLLQGPAGPFFRHVAQLLQGYGAWVSKINLNPGDALFYRGPDAVSFRGTAAEWPGFLTRLAKERRVDFFILFGDCRPYHQRAMQVAERLGIEVYVFEEGYVRPDFVTFEKGGVNGYSSIPKDPRFYRALRPERWVRPRPVGNTFWRSGWYAALHSLACTFLGWRYPHYRHHRDVNVFRQLGLWLRAGVRKLVRQVRDRGVAERLETDYRGRYFFVPLQVNFDSQLSHSKFRSVGQFLETVVGSFAARAPQDTLLVVKHHPMDRPYNDYTRLLSDLAARHALARRVWYVDVVHLPTCLKHARGVVVINSTVGMSAIHHGTPTKCLGQAVYDIPGLTHQGSLDDFWNAPGSVDAQLYRKFEWWVRANTQLNGSVWGKLHRGAQSFEEQAPTSSSALHIVTPVPGADTGPTSSA